MKSPFTAQPRIFVVDDEVSIAKMLAVILQMNLFDAVPFSDPDVALEAVRAQSPDYLISDVVMPGMNGIDLAIAVRDAVPACKVLLFSGQPGAPELLLRARDAGYSFPLVEKPIHPKNLVQALRAL